MGTEHNPGRELHWEEGLFLQPHHLQQFQRNLFRAIGNERRYVLPYHHGVVTADLVDGDLENFRLKFSRLQVVFRSGLYFDYRSGVDAQASGADNLEALDIRRTLESRPEGFKIFLGVPERSSTEPNILTGNPEDVRARMKRYALSETEVVDENQGDNPQTVTLRRLRGQLLVEGENMSGFEGRIPILRVTREMLQDEEAGGAYRACQDSAFFPPTLVLQGCPRLRSLVNGLIVAQLEKTRGEIVPQLGHGAFSLQSLQGRQVEQFYRLRAIARSENKLKSLLAGDFVTPFAVYLELLDLLGELAALNPSRGDFEPLPYNHDDPYAVFKDLQVRICNHLEGQILPPPRKVPFVRTAQDYEATFGPTVFEDATGHFLGIRTAMDTTALTALVTNGTQFRLIPHDYKKRAIGGITLAQAHDLPPALQPISGVRFFRLATRDDAAKWERFETDTTGPACIEFDGFESADFEITLYILGPEHQV